MQKENPERETIEWDGVSSVARANDALRRGRAVQLELPAKLHEAALARLVTDADRDAEPVLEIRGGHELVAELAGIEALAPMADLGEPVRERNYRIAVASAAPVIFIEPTPGARETPERAPLTVPFRTPGTA